ncbi:hypothetical protein GCM10010872_24380 [Dyella flava]|nr:hypothetical protein GCM10010872_24380 [Dyella flava]
MRGNADKATNLGMDDHEESSSNDKPRIVKGQGNIRWRRERLSSLLNIFPKLSKRQCPSPLREEGYGEGTIQRENSFLRQIKRALRPVRLKPRLGMATVAKRLALAMSAAA